LDEDDDDVGVPGGGGEWPGVNVRSTSRPGRMSPPWRRFSSCDFSLLSGLADLQGGCKRCLSEDMHMVSRCHGDWEGEKVS